MTVAGISERTERKDCEMTTKADRSEMSRAMAKAIAYRDCGKPEIAAKWAARLVDMLEAQNILRPGVERAEG
jgi:hypothetical protein